MAESQDTIIGTRWLKSLNKFLDECKCLDLYVLVGGLGRRVKVQTPLLELLAPVISHTNDM
jgi:hypothetical protein